MKDCFIRVRDAIGRCPLCTTLDNCGYCVSTLQCISGSLVGPSGNHPCPSWSFSPNDCPRKF